MTRHITLKSAINEALDQEMARDPKLLLFGQDTAGGVGAGGVADTWGGVLGVTKGLYTKYGDRVIDAPPTEMAYVGAAVGAALSGVPVVAEVPFIDFMGVCFDQLLNQAAKIRYMFGGTAEIPLVIRTMVGAGINGAAQHSQMLTAMFTHIPGLKVVCPSTPHDAKGLMIEAIRDKDPVIFCEPKFLYETSGAVPADPYTIPFGQARIAKEGRDVSIVTYGPMVPRALEAASQLEQKGISAEVIDLRTLSPLDRTTVLKSVMKTGRLVAADEAHPRCNIATDIVAQVTEQCFTSLKAAPQMVSAPHTPVPFSPVLEKAYIPGAEQIIAAVSRTMASHA
ncbi:alpha-ketoacid dehydrogenase subunit beta [Bombella sp. TMW 2.2543]|uniref:Alpha-ketoacid dehydrogenase subunit beta n=1 Tax=Bombella pluederhausensis TaxID=2967336 RepID=A0ABT3WG28_9PROT|nr:alpha-ketoacid dehydrogenase subunit beta [Bombella pluederhausensis]MCX5618065.1 alpha-ketoacid dehydrogenase subunit beta [Bombella pluederhausensis]